MEGVSVQKRRRLWRLLQRIGWRDAGDNTLRYRLYRLAIERHRWWDWGHRVMILTGTSVGGNFQEPAPKTWWYRLGPPTQMWRTEYPRHPLSTFQIVTDYGEFRKLTEGLNEDQMYEWQAIHVNQDGELSLGHRYWGGNFYGMRECDVALLRRYLRMWRRLDWFGLRSWLYHQGLHAAVNQKVPFKCHAQPPQGSGYRHWFCQMPRRHEGMHRFNNYVWGDIEGEPISAYHPVQS